MVAFLRRSRAGDLLIFAVNATPVVRGNYRIGVPAGGFYREIVNTDAATYGGSNVGNLGGIQAEDAASAGAHSFDCGKPPAAGHGCL